MMTLTEAQAEQRLLVYKLRAIDSDQDRDPIQFARSHLQQLAPLERRLERLRQRHKNADSLIAEYLAAIARLQKELRLVAQSARIEKLRKLVEKINKLRRGPKAKLLMSRLQLGNSRAVDLTFLIDGYRHEIRALERLKNDQAHFEAEEKKLILAIEAEERRWFSFIEHRLDGMRIAETLLSRHGDLSAVVKDMRGNQTLKKYEEFQNKWLAAVAGMTVEQINDILNAVKPVETTQHGQD